VIVHGGGPQIDQMLDRLGMVAKFRHGVRVTDAATMEIVEMVLAGRINMEIVDLLNRHGGQAVGLSGKDGGLMLTKPLTAKAWAESIEKDLDSDDSDADFGFVGDVKSIDPTLLLKLQEDNYIPVIAPIGTDREGNTYNINADLVAGAIAAALKAEKLVMLTDVKGIRDANGRHLPTVSRKDVQRMVKRGTISEGMLPKVHACLDALAGGGGEGAHHRWPHAPCHSAGNLHSQGYRHRNCRVASDGAASQPSTGGGAERAPAMVTAPCRGGRRRPWRRPR